MLAERAVVDASAAAALLFGEPRAEEVVELMGGVPLTAPTLLEYEIASTCRKKTARHPDLAPAMIRALAALPALGIVLHDPDPSRLVVLAQETDLSTYDAAYLDLALGLGARLITLDARLEEVWRARS